MDWTPGQMSDDVEDRRGSGGGGFGGGGLGLAGVVVLGIISLVTGRNYIGAYLAGSNNGAPTTQRDSGRPVQQSAAEDRSAHLVSFVLDDAQKTWIQILAAQNIPYRHARLVLFRDSTPSGCGGYAQSATGPFYCPADEKVYIDLGFWDDLARFGGSTADFAQAYVVTHELGHHIQNILGTEQKVRQFTQQHPSARNTLSVDVELQADCYAGVWAHNAAQRNIVHASDIQAGLSAAAAVGDDHLQRMQRGTVSPESFTHGTSAQRQHWFTQGMQQGTIAACNTFQNNAAGQ
jgi:predicted metalloprotease